MMWKAIGGHMQQELSQILKWEILWNVHRSKAATDILGGGWAVHNLWIHCVTISARQLIYGYQGFCVFGNIQTMTGVLVEDHW